MKLFDNPASPFCRKVKVVLHETGLFDSVELLPAVGHPIAQAEMPTDHNPLGKIPALLRDTGGAIYDSPVICRFLAESAGESGAALYPADRLWDSLTLEATADGMMDAALLMVYEARCRPEAIRSADWVESQWDKVLRTLKALETRWVDHMAGPLDIGQIAVGCALGYMDLRHGARNWRDHAPQLSEWFATLSERPSFVATMPVG